jgi:Uma2 family endonuclease
MVAATPFERPLTYADIADLPDDGTRHELIWGELYMTPAPTTKHQRAVRRISFMIDAFLQQHGGGELFFSPFDVHLDEFNVVEPDIVVAGAGGSGVLTDAGLEGAPALCIEVLSRSTRSMDFVKKNVLYARFGVPEYWIVDPDNERITVYQLVAGNYVPLESSDGVARSRVLPGLEIDPAGISHPPRPEPSA